MWLLTHLSSQISLQVAVFPSTPVAMAALTLERSVTRYKPIASYVPHLFSILVKIIKDRNVTSDSTLQHCPYRHFSIISLSFLTALIVSSRQHCLCDRANGFAPMSPTGLHCVYDGGPTAPDCPTGETKDRCGQCLPVNSPSIDSCVDCNHIVDGTATIGMGLISARVVSAD